MLLADFTSAIAVEVWSHIDIVVVLLGSIQEPAAACLSIIGSLRLLLPGSDEM